MLMGAHAAPPVRPRATKLLPTINTTPRTRTRRRRLVINYDVGIAFILLSILSSGAKVSFAAEESEALIKFKTSLTNADNSLSNWDPSKEPCSADKGPNWAGVLCVRGKVWALQLEHMGLSGKIDVDALQPLPVLRSLSFNDNNFEGNLPDFKKLGSLKSLFLNNNRFSGDIPDDAFNGMNSLKKVYMANNKFTGKIPTSLVKSPKLLELRIEGNNFAGSIPEFPHDLNFLNVSNNQLDGPLPKGLSEKDPSSFSGNKGLCGKPLDECKSPAPSPVPDNDNKEKPSPSSSSSSSSPSDEGKPATAKPSDENNQEDHSAVKIVLIVLASALGLAALIFLLACRRGNKKQTSHIGRTVSSYSRRGNMAPGSNSPRVGVGEAEAGATAAAAARAAKAAAVAEQHGKLAFVREDRDRFELQDLLRASAEVLGSGSFGSSYKAVLLDGQAVVVKRFKQMNNVGREEFHEHMRRLGRLRHPNLLPLVAYYYRKEEKLLVFDYVQNGSLASHLHGNRRSDQPAGLDWPVRLKIIKGVAKGLAYLHSELPSIIVPHGHLKSSNVLLNRNFEPVLMDYTLVPVVNMEQAQQLMVAYKSPEYAHQGRTTKKTDVWCLGILTLEVLTGKFPANYLAHGAGYGAELASWVNSITVGVEGGEVFDKEMGSTKNAQGQLQKLLKIGVACCQENLEARLDLKEAVEQIDSLKERDDARS